MKILVTGATGFIGSHLIEALSATDAEVLALVRDPGRMTAAPARRVCMIQGDLGAAPELPAGLDVVYHLAGVTKTLNPKDYYTVNAEGTARLFDALADQARPPKVVVLSSLAAGGPSKEGGRRRESDPPAPVTPYGRSKLEGEKAALARKDGFPVVILRVGAVYGPRDRDFLDLFRMSDRGLVLGLGRKRRPLSLCYVRDIVRALLRAAEAPLPSGEIFNIAEPEPHTMDDMGRAASRVMGRRPVRVVIPLAAAYLGVRISHLGSRISKKPTPINPDKFRDYKQPGWVADVEKARRMLGFSADTPFEEALRETADWYRANGWLSRSSG